MELLDLDGLERLAQKSPWIDHVIVLDLIKRLRKVEAVVVAAQELIDALPDRMTGDLRSAIAELDMDTYPK